MSPFPGQALSPIGEETELREVAAEQGSSPGVLPRGAGHIVIQMLMGSGVPQYTSSQGVKVDGGNQVINLTFGVKASGA